MMNEKGEWIVPMTPVECACTTYVHAFSINISYSLTCRTNTLMFSIRSTIVSAFDPSIIPESGGYLYDGVIANDKRAPHASGVEDGKRLWDVSEQRVKQKFEI